MRLAVDREQPALVNREQRAVDRAALEPHRVDVLAVLLEDAHAALGTHDRDVQPLAARRHAEGAGQFRVAQRARPHDGLVEAAPAERLAGEDLHPPGVHHEELAPVEGETLGPVELAVALALAADRALEGAGLDRKHDHAVVGVVGDKGGLVAQRDGRGIVELAVARALLAKGAHRVALERQHLHTMVEPLCHIELLAPHRKPHGEHELARARALAPDGLLELAVGAEDLDAVVPEVAHEDEATGGDGREGRVELPRPVAPPVAVARRRVEAERAQDAEAQGLLAESQRFHHLNSAALHLRHDRDDEEQEPAQAAEPPGDRRHATERRDVVRALELAPDVQRGSHRSEAMQKPRCPDAPMSRWD